MSHVAGRFGVTDDAAGGTPSIEDRADEDAADGILVAKVRDLGAISREVSEPAPHQALVAPLGLDRSTIEPGALPKSQSVLNL